MHDGIKILERSERGCGYRKTHGLYLTGAEIAHECDRFPLIIGACPVCGEQPRFSRGIQKINFKMMFGEHSDGLLECKCPLFCPACHPTDEYNNWLMFVGREYTMESFIEEAHKMGVSKRIPFIPKDFVINRDWVFLARKNASSDEPLSVSIPGQRNRTNDLIFYAFRPSNLEYMITEEEANNDEFIEELISKGITPVLEVENRNAD